MCAFENRMDSQEASPEQNLSKRELDEQQRVQEQLPA